MFEPGDKLRCKKDYTLSRTIVAKRGQIVTVRCIGNDGCYGFYEIGRNTQFGEPDNSDFENGWSLVESYFDKVIDIEFEL